MRRLSTVALLATLAAGVVGALRQRHDTSRVRRGELPPASAPVDEALLDGYGPLARRLATWIPEPPRTRLGRVAAMAWASPLTAVGLLVAATSGRRPRWSHEHGCFLTEGVGGPSAIALRTVGAEANAIGHVVLSRAQESSPRLLAHELVHVRQAERLGPLLFPLYLWLGARYGYRRHPLERAARVGARRAGG